MPLAPAGLAAVPEPSGFATLDDQACSRHAGYTLVHCPTRVAGPLARHLQRQSETAGRKVTCVDAGSLAEPWRELGRLLNVDVHEEPFTFASSLFRRIGRNVVVVCAQSHTHWGGAVADELAALASRQRFEGWIVEVNGTRQCPYAPPIAVAELLEQGDLDRWWQALWQAERLAGGLAPVDRLDEGERWWWAVRAAGRAPSEPLSSGARALLGRLGACRRFVPTKLQAELGTRDAMSELVERDMLVVHEDGSACPRQNDGALAREDTLAASALLAQSTDPWDTMRAAELLVEAGELDRGCELAWEVLDKLVDPCARMDLWSRWEDALSSARGPGCAERLQGFAALALRLGDVEQAFTLARLATAHAGDAGSPELLLCLGRAAAARGESSVASTALEAVLAAEPNDGLRARALVVLAEMACTSGDDARAADLADQAMQLAADATTKLAARAVHGRLLLAKGAWREAELHYAADAHQACCLGELEAQLDAELSRGAALVMGGRFALAQTKFQEVLEAATSRGLKTPSAFALGNLALLAARRQDLAEALRLRERSVRLFRRIGQRSWLALASIDLADLRVDLGLVDEAEQGLVFARRLLGQRLRATEAAFIGYVACRAHLARQDTVRAAAAIQEALGAAPESAERGMLAQCHCQAARVALADGNVALAAHHISLARSHGKASACQAELALLDALLARLEAREVEPLAITALEVAHGLGDSRRAAEAHRLLCVAATSAGDLERARAERDRATALDETFVAGLPADVATRCRALLERQTPVLADGAPAAVCAGRSRTSRQGLVGSHPCMRRLRHTIEKIAPTEGAVLVVGESGTGKELVANALHQHSRRAAGPLIKVNCAALVETLLISELFGHEKGAFTGASQLHRGCFEVAAGGTIFLDEIGDISPATQAALLRVLQEHTFLRVGGTDLVHADVRIVCATHRDLRTMVQEGCFREDLYYRLSALVLEVPPLRERADDIPLLCTELLARVAREQATAPKRVSADAIALLSQQPWPGNVRELENALRGAALFADGDVLTAEQLRRHASWLRDPPIPSTPPSRALSGYGGDRVPSSRPMEAPAPMEPPPAPAPRRRRSARTAPDDVHDVEELIYGAVRSGLGLRDAQKRLELHCIVRALRETGGHIGRAAALLGIKRPRLSQLIKEYNLKGFPEEPGARGAPM